MKITTTGGATVSMLLRDFGSRGGVMLRDLATKGGQCVTKGSRVNLEGSKRFIWITTAPCTHCGVKFTCRIDAKEAIDYVAIEAIDALDLTTPINGSAK
jgi:hypothetical protein